MAVTGTFAADFSSFYDAVQKAEVHLRSFESGAAKVEKALDRMVDNFSGRKVISEATMMAEAIERGGGVTKLTGAELQRAGQLAEEAAEKMRRLGMDVPPGLDRISKAANEANPALGGLRNGVSQFDGVLGAFGINVNKQVKGIEDIGSVSGKTTSQIGALGSAGLIAGAAFAGWETGRAIANFFELDKAIAGTTARLMGWGDLAGAEAAAASERLAEASFIAGRNVHNLGQALRIIETEFEKSNNRAIEWTQRMTDARNKVLDLTEAQIKQIQTARDLGATTEQLKDKYGITADMLVALDKQLAITSNNEKKIAETRMKLAEDRVEALKREEKAAEQNAKRFANLAQENLAIELSITATKQQAKDASIEAEFQKEVAKLNKIDKKYGEYYALLERQRDLNLEKESANYDQINAVSRTALQERADQELKTLEVMQARWGEFSASMIALQKETWLAAKDAVQSFGLVAVETVDKVQSKAKQATDAIKAATEAAEKKRRDEEEKQRRNTFGFDVKPLVGFELDNLKARFHQAGDRDDDQALWRAQEQLASMEGRYKPTDNASFFQMQRDQLLLAQLRLMLGGKERPPGFASGVDNFAGGLAYVHKDEMLVNLPSGTDVIPAGRTGGGGAPIFNINVNAGLGDRYEIARTIKAVLVAEYKSLGLRAPGAFGG